jgi:two-component system, OmpR family, phosphate regulon sensor histidine kinase PhoR
VMTLFKETPSTSWSAFKWFFAYNFILLLSIGSFVRIYINKKIDHDNSWTPIFLNNLDQTLVYSFWCLILVSALFSFIFVRHFFNPLGILIKKSKNIKKENNYDQQKDVIHENRGEWYQLDLTLNKISKDLKRKKAEVVKERSELEAVITAANDAILAIDKDMNIKYYNAPMALFFNQTDEGNWGKKIKEVIRNQKIIEAFEKAILTQKTQRIQTVQELAANSSLHYYQISISPFLDEKKTRTRGAVAIFHDITEHKKIEKVRMDFVANASHELKTPLTSIQGYIEYIKSKQVNQSELEESYQIIDNNLNRLNRLISDLLELSKIESSEVFVKEKLNIHSITKQVIEDLKNRVSEKKHKVNQIIEVSELNSNKELIEHILVNLLENAIKYCPDSSDIKVQWGAKNGITYLSVKDNGPGIESYHQGRIFERFFRVRDERNQKIKGTGLGLSIVRNCMQKLGGQVDVKSAPGLGSEFICYFPND